MLHQSVELHNAAEVHYLPEQAAWRPQRVPEQVRLKLNTSAQQQMLAPDNLELRFVADGPCRITLSSAQATKVAVLHGAFDTAARYSLGTAPTCITVDYNTSLAQLDQRHIRPNNFSPKVIRLVFGARRFKSPSQPVYIHSIEGDNIRPPAPAELPKLRYLAYGTSITHGAYSENALLSYVGHTARRLGADLINLGTAGSAHCEPELADYIAQRRDWQIATLALSVNMERFALPEFYQRVSYMINTVAGADPTRPVACITLFPYRRDFGLGNNANQKWQPEEARQALRDAVQACPHPNAHLIEGPELLTEISGLSVDLLHPSDFGMMEIGLNLAPRLQALLDATAVARPELMEQQV